MHPHPILMHTLYQDRNREVEAALMRRQVNRAYDAIADPTPRHLVVRFLALLASIGEFPKDKATGAAAALRN